MLTLTKGVEDEGEWDEACESHIQLARGDGFEAVWEEREPEELGEVGYGDGQGV